MGPHVFGFSNVPDETFTHPLEIKHNMIGVITDHKLVKDRGFLYYLRHRYDHPSAVDGVEERVRCFLYDHGGFNLWQHYDIEDGPTTIGGDTKYCKSVIFVGKSAKTMAKMLDLID